MKLVPKPDRIVNKERLEPIELHQAFTFEISRAPVASWYTLERIDLAGGNREQAMLQIFKRHPIPIQAEFGHCLVLTYALPAKALAPMLPSGLTLETYEDHGFLAIAMVQTRNLRPILVPRILGQDFFLCGYRLFSLFAPQSGGRLRGLYILRSDTDRRLMSFFGEILTHYRYRRAEVRIEDGAGKFSVDIRTPRAEADLHVVADLESKPAPLPQGSPFSSVMEARKYAGPLPFTFGYERETHSIIVVQGVRTHWDPQPVLVEVSRNTFLEQLRSVGAKPILANSFHMRGVPYRWERGVRYPLPKSVE